MHREVFYRVRVRLRAFSFESIRWPLDCYWSVVVFEHADRIIVLNRGVLIAEGSPAEVRGNPQVQAVYLGEGLVYDARHREGASM